MKRFKVLRGMLDLLILKVLAATREMSGSDVGRELARRSGGVLVVGSGSLRPALHRLNEKGYIALFPGKSIIGRKGKIYRLTAEGKKHMITLSQQWRANRPVIDNLVEGKDLPQEAERSNEDFVGRIHQAGHIPKNW